MEGVEHNLAEKQRAEGKEELEPQVGYKRDVGIVSATASVQELERALHGERSGNRYNITEVQLLDQRDPARGNEHSVRDNRALGIIDDKNFDAETTEQIQTEFNIIQDSLRRVRLPNSLKLNIAGGRVTKESQQVVNVLRRLGQ